MEKLRRIKAEREALGDKASGSVASIPPSPVHPNRDPEPAPDKRSKRKAKKHFATRHSPKKAQMEAPSSVLSNRDQLFAPDLGFYKGVNMSLSSVERGALSAASTKELGDAFWEMQSRTLAFAKVLRLECSKGSSSEVAKLKKELAASNESLQTALDVNTTQGEALQKAESDREVLRSQLEASKKERDRLSAELKSTKETLAEATAAHDQEVSTRVQLQAEVNDLKDYVLSVHSGAFRQAVRQAVLLYGVPENNDMDENKEVFNGRLVPIKDLPPLSGRETTDTALLDDDSDDNDEKMP